MSLLTSSMWCSRTSSRRSSSTPHGDSSVSATHTPRQSRRILQGYLEYGTFNANGYNGESDAGVVFLGNIKEEKMNEYEYMLGELPTLFQETALLDRIHGFVMGWDIPRIVTWN